MTPTPASTYRIVDVTVIDVEKGLAVPGQTVTVSGERIEKISAAASAEAAGEAQTIDGRGLYLLPGLVDAHVHYFDAPIFGRLLLANGVVLVRDMGNPNETILKLRDELNRGETLGPEMVAAGYMLDGNPAVIPPIALSLSTPEQGREAVRKQAQAGVDSIKVYSRLDRDTFLAILDEANKLDLKVVGHVPDSIYLEDATAAGMDSLEHWLGFEKVIAKLLGEPVSLKYVGMGAQAFYLQRLDEVDPQALQQVYQRLKASGVTIDPTVVTYKNWPTVDALEQGSLPMGEYISATLLSIWKSQWSGQSQAPDFIWKNWARMVKDLNQAGVPLMVGTDLMVPGILPGFSVHEEMEIWQEAGLPPADILRSATLVPAEFMGLGDRLGSIAEGKSASMVLLRADPLEDVGNARLIEGVFLRGKYFSRSDLDGLLQEARELARQ